MLKTNFIFLTIAGGWEAKWYLALKQTTPPNGIYLVLPRYGFGPTGHRQVVKKRDYSGKLMGGGGYEYIFGRGSGGAGTVFGPIPLKQGSFRW